MNSNTKHKAALFAANILAIAASSLQAQTTNYTVYNFDTDQVSGAWNAFYGNAGESFVWDSSRLTRKLSLIHGK